MFETHDLVANASSPLSLCIYTSLSILQVGDASATVTSATLSWITRDLSSMIGAVLFSYWGGKGNRFTRDVKAWRLFADMINDCGLSLEMIAHFFPDHFMTLLCIAALCKSMCGVAAGATRATLTSHFSIDGSNVADIASKEGSQETFVTCLGLLSGLLVTQAFNSSPATIMTSFLLLTLLHIYANYKAVTSLILTSLNSRRLDILLDLYFVDGRREHDDLSPGTVASLESVSLIHRTSRITLGSCTSSTITKQQVEILER